MTDQRRDGRICKTGSIVTERSNRCEYRPFDVSKPRRMQASEMILDAAGLFETLPRMLRLHRRLKAWMQIKGEDTLQLVRMRGDGRTDMSDGFLRLIMIEGDYEKDFFRIAGALLLDAGEFLDVGRESQTSELSVGAKFPRMRFHLFEPTRSCVVDQKESSVVSVDAG